MFWDKVSRVYDLFENVSNRKVYQQTGKSVAAHITSNDTVLECACGTGAISIYVAPVCRRLCVSDYSAGMLRQARKKLSGFGNVDFKQLDITAIEAEDDTFDVVIAGNVIHLLPDPEAAMNELFRVCRDGGRLIIPTYINDSKKANRTTVRLLGKLGADFKRQFDEGTYRAFFENMGYTDVSHEIISGRMACDIAVIQVRKTGNYETTMEILKIPHK